ncbi:MAG: metallophosphoesterase family protein [Verrucomicrobia bacterium]|nr:metallophosphoesterase family protein [Verrucomicrobiota bacterium]
MSSDPTIIISDLHLGHRASQIRDPEELVPILKEARSVIFNGDTVEMRTTVDRPVGRHMAAVIARLCHSIGCRPTFVNGNHDPAVSKIDHLDLMDGQILVTHGDILFLGVAPWSRQALAYRKIHLRALANLGPDALMNFEKRLLAAKRTSIKLQLMERPVTEHSKAPKLSVLVQQFWPPHRPFMILRAWLQTPTLAARLCDLFRPNAKYVIVGHTHYPGFWKRGPVTVINTGSYVLHFGALAVLLEGESIEIRKVIKQKEGFALGKQVARFRETPERLAVGG